MTYIVVLLCLAVAGRELYLAFDRRLPDTQADLRVLRSEVHGLDERVGELRTRLADGREAGPPARTPPGPDALADLSDRLARLEAVVLPDGTELGDQVGGISARLTELEASGGAEAAQRITRLSARLTVLENALGAPGDPPAAPAPADLPHLLAELADRVAALEAARAPGAEDAPEELDERVAALERERDGVRALARSLDVVESMVGGLRQELFDRLEQADDTVRGLLLGDDPTDEPLLAAAYERCAAELGLRVRVRESALDPPWCTGYHLSGRPPAELARELLAAARETGSGSALGALLTALGEQDAGIVRIGPFTAVRAERTLACGVLDDAPVRDPEATAARIAELPVIARADLSRLLV